MLPSELQNEDSAERSRFLAALDRQRGSGAEGEGWQAPVELGRHQLALLAARRLKDISDYLLFFAASLAILAVGLGVLLFVGGGLPGLWGPFAMAAGLFLGALLFLVFKFMSDAVRALADMAELARSVESRVNQIAELLEREEPSAQ